MNCCNCNFLTFYDEMIYIWSKFELWVQNCIIPLEKLSFCQFFFYYCTLSNKTYFYKKLIPFSSFMLTCLLEVMCDGKMGMPSLFDQFEWYLYIYSKDASTVEKISKTIVYNFLWYSIQYKCHARSTSFEVVSSVLCFNWSASYAICYS